MGCRLMPQGMRVGMSLTTKVLLTGIPVLYLIGVIGVASMSLSYDGSTVTEAVMFGLQWPLYINHFLS